MIPIGKKYGIDAVFALTKAEDIWRGIEKCLYGNGNAIHFSRYGELPCIRAKQINRGIPIFLKDNKLQFKLGRMVFGIQINDRFQQDEVDAVLSYLAESEILDDRAVNTLIKDGCCIDTYRPCYATLVPRMIRGKYRVYLHLTIEGKAKPKYDRFGSPRHKYGKGIIGADIGTQTVAYTSDTEVGLKNLSERGSSIQTSERKERLLYRAMDRSRRATNPQNYNDDGTVKKTVVRHGDILIIIRRLKTKQLRIMSHQCHKQTACNNELKRRYGELARAGGFGACRTGAYLCAGSGGGARDASDRRGSVKGFQRTRDRNDDGGQLSGKFRKGNLSVSVCDADTVFLQMKQAIIL